MTVELVCPVAVAVAVGAVDVPCIPGWLLGVVGTGRAFCTADPTGTGRVVDNPVKLPIRFGVVVPAVEGIAYVACCCVVELPHWG